MDTKQPNALRLDDALGRAPKWQQLQAAAELRRQHAEIETLRSKLKTLEDLGPAGDDVQILRMGYAAARLEIESLQARIQELGQQARECSDRKVVQLDARIKELEAQLDAVGAGGVEPLRKRDCLHQIQEPDHFRGATKMVDDDSAVMFISLRQRADAWMRVCALLHELRPGWIDTGTGTAAQQALDAIRSMAAQK